MADEVGCRMRSPCVVQGLSISSKFLQRVGRMSLIDHSITVSAEWYQKMKKATPSMIQTVIDSVEATTLLILARLVSLVLAFPLPFSSADAIACGGLDILELLAGYKNRIVGYLRRVFSREEMSKKQGAYLNMLIRFENEIRNMAVGEIRTTVQAFLDTQIGLFDRLDDAIESFYKKWPHSGSSNPGSEESEPGLSDESSFLFRRVTQTFEEVMEQRNLLTWVQGGPSPLEPVWQYLHTLANSLNPDEVSLREFSEQIYFMRIALRTSVQQIKQVSRSAKTSFIGAQLKSVFGTFFPALTWATDFAFGGFKKLTAYEIINRMWKAPEAQQNEGIKDTSREIEDTSASVEDPGSRIIITVQCETPGEGRQRISGNGAPTIDESIGCLGIVEEASTEGDDSSDQHSPSGHDNSAEIEISDNANPGKSSRAARRRRKKSLN